MDRLLARIKLHKLVDCPIEATRLLHELTPDSTLKFGYMLINDRDCCWHTWVETDNGEVMDMGLAIAISRDPEFGKCKIERLSTKPDNIEVHEDEETIKRCEGHVADFWKTAPKKFRDFRSKVKSKS